MIVCGRVMSLRRLGISNYHLFWRRQVQPVGDDEAAELILAQFRGDPGAMRDLRALLSESGSGLSNRRLTDEQVLAGIGHMLASGELFLVREWPMLGGSGQTEASGQDAAPPPPPPASPSKSQQPENPSLPPNTDGAAQAAALAAAANSGTPFCSH
jgi:hypothetical protein